MIAKFISTWLQDLNNDGLATTHNKHLYTFLTYIPLLSYYPIFCAYRDKNDQVDIAMDKLVWYM